MAKYLIEIGETTAYEKVNIHVPNGDDIILKTAYNHYDVAEWLMQLSTGSYGRFNLAKLISSLEKNMLENNNEKLQFVHARICELKAKYYDT